LVVFELHTKIQKWRADGREELDKSTKTRHRGPHIYSSASTHAIDVDKASIMPHNCCVSDCTNKVDLAGEEKFFLSSVSGLRCIVQSKADSFVQVTQAGGLYL